MKIRIDGRVGRPRPDSRGDEVRTPEHEYFRVTCRCAARKLLLIEAFLYFDYREVSNCGENTNREKLRFPVDFAEVGDE